MPHEANDADSLDLILESARIRLVVPGPEHYKMMRDAEMSSALAMRWRHRGRTPGPDEWVARLWDGVTAQYLVFAKESGTCLGMVASYGRDDLSTYAYVAAARFDEDATDTMFMEGVAMLITNTFSSWPIRKIYMEVPEYNTGPFGSAIGSILEEEGRLRGHVYASGQYWDQLVLALYRETWEEQATYLMPFFGRALASSD